MPEYEEQKRRVIAQKLFEAIADVDCDPKLLVVARSLELEAQKLKLAETSAKTRFELETAKLDVSKRRVSLLEEKLSQARAGRAGAARSEEGGRSTSSGSDSAEDRRGNGHPGATAGSEDVTAILPSMKIDSDAQASRYFTPYQLAWIADDSRMRLAEKSIRIGWTFGDAFKNVRKRLRHPNRDYLFSTKDYPSAIEYIATAKKFCEIYNFAKSIVGHGEDTINVPVRDPGGKARGFTEEIKIGYIKFDNGSRIIAFSSDPRAMQVFGGDVGWDEAAKGAGNNYAAELWETAQGRITWGLRYWRMVEPQRRRHAVLSICP